MTEVASFKAELMDTDNFEEIVLSDNGNEVYKNELSQPYGMHGFDEKIDLELDLEFGTNEFKFKVIDLGGHETTEKLSVEREISIAQMKKVEEQIHENG